jgi:hypothetical protein
MRVLTVLAALALGGCINPTESLRYSREGPQIVSSVTAAERPLRPDDRLVLIVANPRADADRVRTCVAAGLAGRLPERRPAPSTPQPEVAARLLPLLDSFRSDPPANAPHPALPSEVAMFDADWLIVMEDRTGPLARTSSDIEATVRGRVGYTYGFGVGPFLGYTLALRGDIFDLRARRRLGSVSAAFDTFAGQYVVVASGGLAAAILPVIRPPVGTTAMAICEAFGQVLGTALLRAAAPLEPPAP